MSLQENVNMDWDKPLGVGIFDLIQKVKMFDFIKNEDEMCVYKKIVGVLSHSWYYMYETYYRKRRLYISIVEIMVVK